jgi:hypothetical protein
MNAQMLNKTRRTLKDSVTQMNNKVRRGYAV